MVTHFDDPRLGYVVPGQLADNMALAHHHDSVGQDRQFLNIGRNDDDADAAPRQFAKGLVNLFACADVDAAGGLVEDQELGVRTQPSRDQGFLLVTSREARNPGRRARGFDAKVLDQAAGLLSHLLGREEGQKLDDAQRLEGRDVDVEGDRLRKHQPLRTALLGHKRDPKVNRLGFAADRHALSVHLEMAALKAVHAKSQTARLRCGRIQQGRRERGFRPGKHRS